MDILGQSSILVAVTSFAFGFSVLARNVKNKLHLTWAFLCTCVSVWSLMFFLEQVWGGGVLYRWHLFFNIWLAPVGLAFIRVLVRIQDRTSRRLLEVATAAALGLSVALVFRFESMPWVLQAIYFAPAFVVLQTVHLMWVDRRLRRGIKRLPKLPTVGFGRRNLIYVGGLVVLGFSVMDHVPWMGRVIPAIGNIALSLYIFLLSQAITQQRLLNFGALASRILVLVFVALTLTGVYSLLVGWIQNSPGLFFLNSFITSFIILMLLDPLRSLVRYFTQRLLTQKHQRLESVIRDAQRRLAGVVDPGALFQEVLLVVEQTLLPQWAALFVLRADGTKFRRVRQVGDNPLLGASAGVEPKASVPADALPREILAGHTLLQYCERLQRRGELAVLLDQMLENEIDRSASRSQREHLAGLLQGLKALGGNLLIPLSESGRILGFAIIHAPVPPDPWGNNWGLLQVLLPYFELAGQTLTTMEVFVRQREKERLAALGEMAAGLAHEIRNPLGAIKGAAQYLDPTVDRPESRFLKVIVEEVDRLNRVVTQFLDYSKPSGQVELRRVDASELAERSIESIRPAVPQGVQLAFEKARMEIPVLAVPEQIQHGLLNLVQNSFRAIEKRGGEGRVRVSVGLEGMGKFREAIVTVEDDGPGISREHLDKIFIPFFTTSPSGTGLGLSICQKIVEAHRGRIEVASEEGRGARFSVVLPFASDEGK